MAAFESADCLVRDPARRLQVPLGQASGLAADGERAWNAALTVRLVGDRCVNRHNRQFTSRHPGRLRDLEESPDTAGMPRPRRSRRPWWWSYRDQTLVQLGPASHNAVVPFDFMAERYLESSAWCAKCTIGSSSIWSASLHTGRPLNATNGFLLRIRSGDAGPVERDPLATRIDPVAAQVLYDRRVTAREHLTSLIAAAHGSPRAPAVEAAVAKLVTRSAWCTDCGAYFQHAGHLNHETLVDQWCPACQKRDPRTPHPPQKRLCAATDCDTWFRPRRIDQQWCSKSCHEAARLARLRGDPSPEPAQLRRKRLPLEPPARKRSHATAKRTVAPPTVVPATDHDSTATIDAELAALALAGDWSLSKRTRDLSLRAAKRLLERAAPGPAR